MTHPINIGASLNIPKISELRKVRTLEYGIQHKHTTGKIKVVPTVNYLSTILKSLLVRSRHIRCQLYQLFFSLFFKKIFFFHIEAVFSVLNKIYLP